MIFAYVSPEHSPEYDVQNTNGIDIFNGKIVDIISTYPHVEMLLEGDLNALVRDFYGDTLRSFYIISCPYNCFRLILPTKNIVQEKAVNILVQILKTVNLINDKNMPVRKVYCYAIIAYQ